MIKCFLSHSSKDKEHYVRIVAENLRQSATIFDEVTFEKGMQNIEEIHEALDETSLFVIFLSNHSLDSDWVKEELVYAKNRLDKQQLDRIYPIIIDENIRYDDVRIPDWMRHDLNIQLINSPKISARKINSRLVELTWKFHPRLKERQEIFVGRNDLIQQVEERMNDFSRQYPIAIIASGLPYIGRKSFLHYASKKSGLIKGAYQFIYISLDHQESIEDILVKIADTGVFTLTKEHKKMIYVGSMEDKISLAKEIFLTISNEQEKVLIEDHGVLVQRNGEIVDWFKEVLESLKTEKLICCIATQFRPNPSLNRTFPLTFSVAVKELEKPDRSGLLKRYAEFQGIDLCREDLQFFSDILTGYPQQVFFAIDQIKEQGIFKAKGNSHQIQQFASDKAKIVFDLYKNNEEIQEFILLLAKFEFISYEVLFNIVEENKYIKILENLITNSICEHVGKASEYIRINEVLRDYISRNRFELSHEFSLAIKSYASDFVVNYQDDRFDISGYLLSAKEILLNGGEIPAELILPSVFIRAIKKLYDEDRNYEEAISLSSKVLVNEKTLHENTVNYIRFLKCQALARVRKSDDFFVEVNKLSDKGEQEFLKGFFFRLQGKSGQAESHLNIALAKKKYNDPKVIGELIRIYMQNEDYGKAYSYARENYYNRPGNIINANDYFTCTLMQDDEKKNRQSLEEIINKLSIDPSDKAKEVVLSMRARISVFYDGNIEDGFSIIDDAISQFPKIVYPLLTKADLAVFKRDKARLQEAVDSLERLIHKNAQTYRSFIRYKAYLLTMNGKGHDAAVLIDKELHGLNQISIDKFKDKLQVFNKSY